MELLRRESATALSRVYAYAFSVVVLAAVCAPVLLDPLEDDGFPLSTYPMFARERPAEIDVTRAAAIQADGTRRTLPPRYVATSAPMQAYVTLRRVARDGKKASKRLCRSIAEGLDGTDYESAVQVEIVTLTVEPAAWIAGEAEPRRKVHAVCAR